MVEQARLVGKTRTRLRRWILSCRWRHSHSWLCSGCWRRNWNP